MKPKLRDSILVAISLITILGCGFGLGRLNSREVPTAPVVPAMTLEEETLKALRTSLDLTPEQEKSIAEDLDQLNRRVLDSRRVALLQYYESLLVFHDDISQKLNPRQREILRANKRLLENEKSARFQAQP